MFDDEIRGVKLEKGIVAMANLGRPKTNGSQFFILVTDAPENMEGKYTVFGKVTAGIDIVEQINGVAVGEKNIPLTPVILKRIKIE